MANQHDAVIKDLINNREFAVSWLRQYMHKELLTLVDWDSVVINSANVEHSRQSHKKNIKSKEQSDISFAFKFKNGNDGAIFVHVEAQTTNDETLIIRVRHYQTAYLLDFIKKNKGVKKLPLIVSIIYYANKQPFTHGLDINDYFQNPALAKKHAFTTKFVDLNRMSDEEISNHGYISPYELVLKYIRENNIDKNLDIIASQLTHYDSIYCQVLIKYMYYNSALEPDLFYNKMIELQPTLEGDVMTTAEQLKKRSFEQGIEQGIEKGIEKGIERGALNKAKDTAKNMLSKGYNITDIIELTGLATSVIDELKTQH